MHLKLYLMSFVMAFAFLAKAQSTIWSPKAQWIGISDSDQSLYSQYMPVFRIGCNFRSLHKDFAFSLIWGADDERLLSPEKNILMLSNRTGESWVKMTYHQMRDTATIGIYRSGYSPDDNAGKPLKVLGVPRSLLTGKSSWHHIAIASCLGDSKFYIDGTEIGSVNLNPLGLGGDFITYPVLAKTGISAEKGQEVEIRDFTISNFRSPQNTIAFVRELDGSYNGNTRVIDPSRNSLPLLRGTFHVNGDIANARLLITARGIYDVRLNGVAVNHGYMNPGAAQYNKTQPYQAFDVTSMLRQDDNQLDIQLAEGWWMGAATYEGVNWNYFGDRMSMRCQLEINYRDGHRQLFTSNPAQWKYCVRGPILCGSLFQGEVYDATKEEIPEDTGIWKPCDIVGLEGHISHTPWGNAPPPDDYSHLAYVEYPHPDIDSVMTLTAKSFTEPRTHLYIYDMGQNMAGVPMIHFHGLRKGQKIAIRYAEVCYPDLPEYKRQRGMLMLENIRAAMAQDIYIAKGDRGETFSPRYTSHGFRYMEISGLDTPLPATDVQAIVLSSVRHIRAHYECSDSLVNRLWKNIEWSTRANFMSIPTDCPQRNERLGWCGDISVFSPTATYLTDADTLLGHFLRSMRDVQHADGRFPDVAPLGGGFGGFLWGSAGITVPWEMYCQWGDTVTLRQQYAAMKRYVSYVQRHDIDPATGIIVQDRQWGDLGDWLSPVYYKDDKSLIWEAYYIHVLDIMAETARVLHDDSAAAEYELLAAKRREFFCKTYIDAATGHTKASAFMGKDAGKIIDTQTSYVLPLAFNIVSGSQRQQLINHLLRVLSTGQKMDDDQQALPYSLLTGFIGTSWICRTLSQCGHSAEAYRLLMQRSYPSWLYPVTQGATTIWERLNSYTHKNGFGGNNRMNSFNHYSFGAVGYWLISNSIGIQRDPKSPGFRHFVWAPEADQTGSLKYASGWYDSHEGRIESSWRITEKGIRYDLTIPDGASATRKIPGLKERELKAGKYLYLVKRK